MERASSGLASKLPCELEPVATPLRPVSQLEHVGSNQVGLFYASPDANTARGHYTQGPILTKFGWPPSPEKHEAFLFPV